MPEKQPTIYDVAEAAGVSIATVSRVMSGGSASARAREKVERAIEALKYHPSSVARGLDRHATRTFALVVSDLTNPYYAALTQGALEEAARSGYVLQLYNTALESEPDTHLIARLLEQRLDGAVLVGGIVDSSGSEEALERLMQLQKAMPLVTIGPHIEGLACINITSDLSISVRKSIAHLTALGHRRIAFIGGSARVTSATIRESAFYQEMRRLGLDADPDVRNETGFTPQAGELCVTKLFSRLPRERRPTAMIAINDLVALGALRQLQRMGLRVPEDVALIGCDNQFFTSCLNPPLTTVDLHPYDHGQCAVAELVSVCSGMEQLSFSQIRECSLIVRESCGAALGVRRFD